MNSISIGWKKQSPGDVQIVTKKKNDQNRIPRTIIPRKPQQAFQNIEPLHTGIVRSNIQPLEHPSYLLKPTQNFTSRSINDPASQIKIFDDKRLCSPRAAAATFIIAVILIAATGTSIGIVFGVINSSSSSGTGNNNQNSYTTITSGSVTSSIRIGSQTGSGCSGYTEINDPTRSINNVGSYGSCDNGPIFNASNGGSWIRFVGTGGDRIPMSSAGLKHCGGYLSGWSNNTLPTTQDVVTNGTVCFETEAHECGFTVDVSIIYCSAGYYVYFLPPISVCNARYCTT
ncbi:unnamed protein product [Rotaria sordida]|uniref:Uncharacterized protein n=1 Tax=Rotaria sordida TaxID=392033 RepID=A0A819WMP4_9BILA|nr:unnamed protein product [Rotaria sordida]